MTYHCEGSGPGIVLIPGLGCDTRMWGPVSEALRGDFALLHPHSWGRGSLREAAGGVAEAIREEGLGPAGVVGLSMGGYIAFELLRHWPERVRAVALLDTTAYPDDPERAAKRQQVLRLLGEGRFPEVLEAFVSSVLAPRHREGPIPTLMREMGRDLGPETFAADVRAILERGSHEDVLPGIRVPTLFAAGAEDQLTPPEVARAMAREVPGARVVEIPASGHMTPVEEPETTADALRAHFRSALGTR